MARPTPSPTRRPRPGRPEPEVTEAGPLAAAMAALRVIDQVMSEHPDLPEVMRWAHTSEGVTGSPYLLARPVSALAAWVAALPAKVFITTRVPAGEWGTELVARCRLAGHTVELTVVTWRDVACNGTGTVSGARLAAVVAEETRGLGQPADPERTGPAVPIEPMALTIPTPAEVRTGIWT